MGCYVQKTQSDRSPIKCACDVLFQDIQHHLIIDEKPALSLKMLSKGVKFMKHNPDDRRDNVDRIQRNIDYTIDNIERADEMIETTSDDKMKQVLKDKNQRREEALEGLRHEIKDEADAAKNDYKN